MLIELLANTAQPEDPDNSVKLAIIGVIGTAITGIVSYLTVRYNARKSTKTSEESATINERQVDVAEWQALLAEIRAQARGLSERVTELEEKDEARRQRIEELEDRVRAAELARDQSDLKYRTAVRHIKALLVWAVDPNRSDTPPVTPEELVEDLK